MQSDQGMQAKGPGGRKVLINCRGFLFSLLISFTPWIKLDLGIESGTVTLSTWWRHVSALFHGNSTYDYTNTTNTTKVCTHCLLLYWRVFVFLILLFPSYH